MIKLIVSDMDGTLLNDQKQIDDRIYALLPGMHKKGIRFVVASGRQYPSLKKNFQEHLQDIVVIAENGAFVVQDTKELYYRGMTQAQLSLWLDAVAQLPDVEPLLCAKYCGYTHSKEMYDYLRSDPFYYDMVLVDDLHGITEDVTKVSLIERGGRGAQFCYDRLAPLLTEEMTLVISGDTCLDTGLKGVNKGSAVAALQQMWQIRSEETLVFGDQFNDVDMFDCAFYSYAMGNASREVRQRARFVTGTNNEGAVVNVIRELTGL